MGKLIYFEDYKQNKKAQVKREPISIASNDDMGNNELYSDKVHDRQLKALCQELEKLGDSPADQIRADEIVNQMIDLKAF